MKNVLVDIRFTLDIPRENWPREVQELDDGTDDGRVAALEHLEAVFREGEWSQYLDYIHGGDAEVEADG